MVISCLNHSLLLSYLFALCLLLSSSASEKLVFHIFSKAILPTAIFGLNLFAEHPCPTLVYIYLIVLLSCDSVFSLLAKAYPGCYYCSLQISFVFKHAAAASYGTFYALLFQLKLYILWFGVIGPIKLSLGYCLHLSDCVPILLGTWRFFIIVLVS